MARHLLTPALMLLAVLIVGCGPQAREYQVVVANQSSGPVTVWLTKNGPPVEKLWLAPEQVAFMTLVQNDSIPGAWLEPGKQAAIGPIKGNFDSGSDAVLRIYHGRLKISQIVAVSAGSALRDDITLKPGANMIVIDKAGRPSKR